MDKHMMWASIKWSQTVDFIGGSQWDSPAMSIGPSMPRAITGLKKERTGLILSV